jgi:chromosome segregation ATPase
MNAARCAVGLFGALLSLGVPADGLGSAPPAAGATRTAEAAPESPASPRTPRAAALPSWDAREALRLSDIGPAGFERQIHGMRMAVRHAKDDMTRLADQQDRASTALEEAQADLDAIRTDLKKARADADSADASSLDAEPVIDEAKATRARALKHATAAQEAMTRATVRLGDLMEAATAATGVAARTADRVEQTSPGSGAHRTGFAAWQMAAVADRAAHARLTVAKDAGADLFAQVEAAEAALAEAEMALTDARSAHRKAERSAREIAATIVALTTQVPAAEALVELRTVEAEEAAAALAAATRIASEQAARLAELEQATPGSHSIDDVPAPHEPSKAPGGQP